MPYTLDAGRVIVAPDGRKLVALSRVQIPEAEHPDGSTGAHTLTGPEADALARQIVAALNAPELSPELRDALKLVCGHTESYLDDLGSGLDEGLYEEGEDELKPGRAAVATVSALLKRDPEPRHRFEVLTPTGAVRGFYPCDVGVSVEDCRAAAERLAERHPGDRVKERDAEAGQ